MFNSTEANTLERVHWFRTFHFSFLSDPNLSSTNSGTAGTVNVIFWPDMMKQHQSYGGGGGGGIYISFRSSLIIIFGSLSLAECYGGFRR